MRNCIRVFLFLLMAVSVAASQASILDQCFDVYTPQGLSSGTAYTTLRGDDGFIWTSTRNGIDRYDGVSYRHYSLNGHSSRGLHDGMMIYLYQAPDGQLWVYTERSHVYRYNPLADKFEEAFLFPGEDGVGSLRGMCVFGQKALFGFTNGLMCYDFSEGLKRETYILSDRNVRCLVPFSEGRYLIGTNKGLAVYDPATLEAEPLHEHFFVDVCSLYYDAEKDVIWVGTDGQGLYYVEADEEGAVVRLGDEPLIVHSICPCDDHEVLVGTDGNGLLLAQHEGGNFTLRVLANDTPDAVYPIHCSCVRHVNLIDDRVWISMHFGGVARLQSDGSLFGLEYPGAKSPSDRYVFGADIDAEGRIWVAYNQAIGCYSPEGDLQGIYLDHTARYLAVKAMPDGTVWCGGFNTGLYHFDPVTLRSEFFESLRGSSAKDCVYDLHIDTRGYLWVGGLNFGMTCIMPAEGRQIGDDPLKSLRFEHTNIRQVCDIEQLNDSTLAVATTDGLYLYNYYTDLQEHYLLVTDDSPWQGTNFFSSLAVRHGHEVWLAADGAGLVLFDLRDKSVKSFGIADGIPSLELRGIALVNDSTLCVSTELGGIFLFDCERQQFRHSLPCYDGSLFQQNAIYTDGSKVVAGCDKCALVLTPADMAPHRVEASIHIDGHPIIDECITLPASAPHLSLDFSMTDIYHQAGYHYFYCLHGIDEELHHLSGTRHIEYPKLPAGTYQLEVRAVGSEGQWFTRTLQIRVERDFSSYLPYILGALVLVLVGLLLARYFKRQRG